MKSAALWSFLLFPFCFLFLQPGSEAQERYRLAPQSEVLPRPEAIAETRLLMEGLNLANFRGLERILASRPTSTEAWTFARGQALLIAETGNLLMLRQPRAEGRTAWLDRAAEQRASATRLARSLAARNYEQSRTLFISLASNCNQCHQSFRVAVRITPFAQPADRSSTEPVP